MPISAAKALNLTIPDKLLAVRRRGDHPWQIAQCGIANEMLA